MFLRQAQADDPDGVVVGAFGEDHHVKAGIDLADADKANFAIVETIVIALERRVPIEGDRRLQRDAVLGPIDFVLGRIELDFDLIYVHPFNGFCKRARGPHHTRVRNFVAGRPPCPDQETRPAPHPRKRAET
jgi:hypothetical protein